MLWWIVVAAGVLVFAMFGAWVAAQRDREPVEGFVLGLVFGPLGVLVEALLPTGAARPREAKPARDDGEPAIDPVTFVIPTDRKKEVPREIDKLNL